MGVSAHTPLHQEGQSLLDRSPKLTLAAGAWDQAPRLPLCLALGRCQKIVQGALQCQMASDHRPISTASSKVAAHKGAVAVRNKVAVAWC